MRRVIVKRFTGSVETKPTVARRLVRKIRGSIAQRQSVLLDFEGTTPSPELLEVLAAVATPSKVRFCGLAPALQEFVRSRQKEMS